MRDALYLGVLAVGGKLEVRIGCGFRVGLEVIECEGSGCRSISVAIGRGGREYASG